jgi:hypothetical protein
MSATSVSMSATNVPGSCHGGRPPGRRRTSTAVLLVGVTVTIVLGGCTTSTPGSGPASGPRPEASPSQTGRARQSSGGDSLSRRTTTHLPTGSTCNQGAACITGSFTRPPPPTVSTSDLEINSSTCLPVDGQGQSQCEVVVASRDGRPFSLGSVTTTDPSPGSKWSADSACIGPETLPGQPCVIKIQACGPVGQTLTAQLMAQGADGLDLPGTPLTLDAIPAAAGGSPSSSTTP